ncbi:MAG TPA: hypothetical protein PLE88_12155 [Anaerohalosphaeraceae bacterium]|nr:hypothetical protein [Anaerohalosphaeraceae bacterium]
MDDDKVVVFGINYDSLSYVPPVEEKTTNESLEANSLESLDFGGESMMMSMGYQTEEPVWFDNPAECPDLDNDDFVNFVDYAIFAGNWLETGSELAGDFDEDGTVDVNDLIHFCDYWLTPVDCPEYYSDPLPYQCSFEPSQGFVSTTDPNNPVSLDYQEGWQVPSGIAELYETYYPSGQYLIFYNYVWVDPNTVITKDFISNETDDTYIRTSIVSNQGAEILLMNDSNSIVAGLKFGSNNHYEVYDNGSYSSTSSTWQAEYWIDLMFVMNYSSNNYDVYYYDWGSESYVQIGNDIDFDGSYSTINRVEYHTANLFSAVDKLSITDYSTSGGTFGESGTINITSPCACDTDDPLKGKVPVVGSVWWESLGDYVISCCPYDLDYTDKENWVEVARGDCVVDNDVLGHWNTDRIPNGYYYLRLDVCPDYDVWDTYTGSWVNTYGGSWIYKTLSIGGTVVYDDLGYFPVVGELKSNTFYHEEEPDISVPWAGTFPFEFKRTFNNNRKFYTKPLYNGWTHNSQIKLIEDTRYDWNLDTTAWPVPDYDADQLGMGYIWLEMPDGSRQLFTCEMENVQARYETITYKPYHNDNGEYIKRTSYVDLLDEKFDVYYTLYQRDGTELYFYSIDNSLDIYSLDGGFVGWKVEMGISTMSDRFGNTLSYSWRKVSGKPVAVSSISGAGKQILFTFDNDDRYTKAELKIGSTVYRTVEFDNEDIYDGTSIHSVTKKGKGVNEQGVYNGVTDKEYVTKYEYDSGHNLRKVVNVNNSSQDETLIEVDYDGYGRVQTRKDYIESANYLETEFTYIFDDPNVPGSGDNLVTIQSTDWQDNITVQNDDGAVIQQETITSDDSAVTNTDSDYEDLDNPLKPTDTYEYFDGYERYTWNDYSNYGDLLEQQVYVEDSNYIATELTYHPDYAFETSQTNWQGLNKTGEKVQKLSIYGNANGT